MGRPQGLPAALSSFIGRTRERAELARLIRASRLVTLTGPGGVGKTRLGLRTAADVSKGFPDGTALVELASITDPAAVSSAIASALATPKSSSRNPLERVIGFVGERRMLMVLDNCEHLIEACAEVADRLLRSCPNLVVLATSRQPLGISGEHAWAVPPMPVPSPKEDSKVKKVGGYEAVRLFVARARQTDKRFSLTGENAPYVAKICRHLDGVPLAIELAACRVEALSPQQIAERLDDRLALLTNGNRAGQARQQSLEGALGWSYELLSAPEQALFRRLSVFLTGFTLEAAERVCAGPELGERQVFDILSSLISKSLLIFNPAGLQPRYRMLETIRYYSRQQLADCAEQEQIQRRHAIWCAEIAERADEGAAGVDPFAWVKRLEPEYENIRAALDWAIDNDMEIAVRLASSTILLWDVRRYFTEGLDWLQWVASRMEQILAKMDPDPSPQRAKVLWGTALLLVLTQTDKPVGPLLEESVAIAKQFGDDVVAARGLGVLGFNKVQMDDIRSGLPLLEESMQLARQTRDKWALANVLGRCGRAYIFAGEPSKAQECFEEFITIARESLQSTFLCDGLYGAGWAALSLGNLSEAHDFLTRALEVAGDFERYQLSLILGLLGELALATDGPRRCDQAKQYFERGLQVARPLEVPFPTVRCLVGLGKVALEENDPRRARRVLEEAVSTARRSRSKNLLAPALHCMAELERAEGDLGAARGLLEEAMNDAKDRGERIALARSVCELGSLARDEGDEENAVTLLQQALEVNRSVGDRLGIARSLDELAGLAAVQQRSDLAVRMFAAAEAMRREVGAADSYLPGQRARLEQDLASAKKDLSAEEFSRHWKEGAAMSIVQAVTYAAKGRGGRSRPRFGWAGLTPAERQIAEFIKQGMTNPEIADKIFVSRHTVTWHVSSIFAKLGISSRKELRQPPQDS